MALPPGKTLLSKWIKNTATDVEPHSEDSGGEAYANPPEPPDPRDRKVSAKLWSDIFQPPRAKKQCDHPEQNTHGADPTSNAFVVQSENGQPTKRRKRHINPHNPFNSYVVSLPFSHHLNEELGKHVRKTEEDLVNHSNEADKDMQGHQHEHQESYEGNQQHQEDDQHRGDHQENHSKSRNHQKPLQGFAEPSLIHVFKISKEALHSIERIQPAAGPQTVKPKPHSFFAKRNTSGALKAGSSPLSAKLRHSSTKQPPWQTVHIRPGVTWEYSSLPRRKRSRAAADDEADQYLLDSPRIARFYIPPQIHKPSRVLAGSSQVRAMALHSLSKASAAANKDLVERVGEPKAFDLGQFESRVWSEMYAPTSWRHHANPQATKQVHDWIKRQFESRAKYGDQKPRNGRRRTTGYNSDDGFVVDDDFDEVAEDDLLIVSGSIGSGKTSAVYAAAKDAEAFVFEVSSSVKRTGKELSSMLDGISQNHAVHKAKNVVILVDDGDVVYENEAGGFWSSLSRFAATSRRPVIVTCTDPRLVAVSNVSYHTIELPSLDLVRVTDLAWLIALSEGHLIDRLRLARLVVSWKGDIRRVLAQLQYWCQMGIGGTPSSEEWVAKEHEFKEFNADRVLSKDTWFPVTIEPASSAPVNHQHPMHDEIAHSFASRPINTLIEQATSSDFSSICDTLPTNTTYFSRQPPEETISANGALPVSTWTEPITIPYRGNEPRLHNIFSMESSYGTSSRDLACDVSPYMRHMVASDLRRQLVIQQALTDQSDRGARMTRRALAASGIDCRHYLELSRGSMDIVLNSGYPTAYFAEATGSKGM